MADQEETFNITAMPIPALRRIFRSWKVVDLLSFSLVSERNSRSVRMAAVLPSLFADVTFAREMNDSFIMLHTEKNCAFEVELKWGLTEARSPRNEVNVELNDKVIRLQKVRGEIDLKNNNLCLFDVGNRGYQIDAFLSYLVFIFPEMKFRNVEIDSYAFWGSLDYPMCLRSLMKTEELRIGPCKPNNFYNVTLLLKNLEITKTLRIDQDKLASWTALRGSCSEEISLRDAAFLDGQSLLTMNCSRITLIKSRFRTEHFLEFLLKWKESDDALERVRYVYIGHAWGVKKLHKQVGATKWDPAKRPKDFFESNGAQVDCSFGMDITKPNGRIGTIMQLTDDFFKFIVWED